MVLAKHPVSFKEEKKSWGKKGGMSPSFPFSFHPTPSILLLPPMLPMQCEFQKLATTYFIHCIYGKVLDYCWFKSKFAILNILKASICTKLSNPRISMLSVIKEDHIVEDVQFRSSTVWSSNPIQPLSSIHSNPNSSKHNCKKKKNSRCAIKACLFFFHPLWATLQLNFHILFILCLSIVRP